MFLGSYDIGRIVDAHGTGSDTAALTGSYTPGTQFASEGLGNLSLRGSVVLAGGGATAIYLRPMDYTDPAKPRQLAFALPGGTFVNEITVSSSSDFDLVIPLSGTVKRFALEKKCAGSAVLGDTVTADCTASEKW